jgi:hypothetical protein
MHNSVSIHSQKQDEDDYSVLDESILDSNTPDMSPTTKLRRESLADDAHSFPSEPNWSNYQFNATSGTMEQSTAAHVFNRPRNQSYAELTSQSMSYPQTTTWPMSATSESFSPNTGLDQLVEFNSNAAFTQPQMHTSPAPVFGSLQLNTAHPFSAGFPNSPQSGKEGWFSTSSPEGLDLRNAQIQGRNQSPPFATSTHLLRRDGIRKKNARFEIPAERNLRTIDQLINQTNDESELKELKQQKRLLRNRQAAYVFFFLTQIVSYKS